MIGILTSFSQYRLYVVGHEPTQAIAGSWQLPRSPTAVPAENGQNERMTQSAAEALHALDRPQACLCRVVIRAVAGRGPTADSSGLIPVMASDQV